MKLSQHLTFGYKVNIYRIRTLLDTIFSDREGYTHYYAVHGVQTLVCCVLCLRLLLERLPVDPASSTDLTASSRASTLSVTSKLAGIRLSSNSSA